MSHDCSILKVFWDFFQQAKYLQHLRKETFDAIENLELSGNFSEDQLHSMRFSSIELEKLTEVLDKPPCLVVMGQSTYGKLAIATRIFEQLIIPMIQIQNSALSTYCKPIRFSQVQSFSSQLNERSQISNFKSVYKSFDALSLEDIEFSAGALKGENLNNEIIDVEISHTLVKDGLQVLIFPTYPEEILSREANLSKDKFELLTLVIPIIVYAITKPYLTENEIVELMSLKETFPELPILFIEISPLPSLLSRDLPESEQHQLLNNIGILPPYSLVREKFDKHRKTSKKDKSFKISENLMHTLCDKIGYLQPETPPQSLPKRIIDGELQIFSDFVNDIKHFSHVKKHLFLVLHGYLVTAASILQQRHSKCMRMIILYAFDMAREIQITPKRINYSKEKESELFDTLMAITSKKQDEIRTVIMESLAEMKKTIVDIVSHHKFKAIDLPSEVTEASTREIRLCHLEIQELLMNSLNESLGRQLSTRFDVMRESYLGTLQRCLENLENDCRVCGESSNIGDALKQMMHAAYQVEVTTSISFIKSFWDKMKQLVTTMPGRHPTVIDSEWKVRAALEIITNLSESKLTRTICNQFRERLKANHDSFVVCMKQLESQLVCKLEEKEEKHLKIKKVDAPRLARVYLESTSLRDSILYGMPRLEREIGRGQYGVVYGCKSWGGYEPCAIKSLVPLDDRHWNDLAMEFHYTKSIPEHDNIVSLRGSVIDYTYAQGDTPAVLLIMDRLNRDLYSGLKSGLDWITRIQVSLDVTRGIRFLHSQGLVHRDIKLKNVLLDENCRAKLTDLGFCKPEAMMSGSVVGTPIHMAPELFTGHYDNSVDVYAFGILFWYICSGNVKLPNVFEQCLTKDNLWSCVKRGGRPERLPSFSDECWTLMSECWAPLPSSRPFLGNVEPQLEKIMQDAKIQLLNDKLFVLPVKSS